jgi:tape measure domain-containing protein
MAERTVKIEYNVDTAAEGAKQVEQLAKEIDELGGEAGETAQRADQLAAVLGRDEATLRAIGSFKSLEASVAKLDAQFEKAQAKAGEATRKQREYAEQVLASGPPTQSQADKLATLTAKADTAQRSAEQLRNTLAQQRGTLTEVSAGLGKAGVDTTKLGAAKADLAAKVTVSRRALNEQISTLVQTKQKLQDAADGTSKLGSAADSVGARVRSLQGVLSSVFGVTISFGLAKQFVEMGEAVQKADAQLRLASKSQEDFNKAQDASREISSNTRAGLADTVNLLSDVTRSTRELNVSTSEQADLTQLLSQGFQITGGEASRASNALEQFNKGLATGKINQEALNALLTQSPRLAQALADALGVTTEELVKLGKEGKLGAEEVAQALLSQKDKINAEFATLPVTVGQALTQVRNSIADFANDTGISGQITKFLKDFAEGVEGIKIAAEGISDGERLKNFFRDAKDEALKAETQFRSFGVVALKTGEDLSKLNTDQRVEYTKNLEGLKKYLEAQKQIHIADIELGFDRSKILRETNDQLKGVTSEMQRLAAETKDLPPIKLDFGGDKLVAELKEVGENLNKLTNDELLAFETKANTALLEAQQAAARLKEELTRGLQPKFAELALQGSEAFQKITKEIEALTKAAEQLLGERLRRLGLDLQEIRTGIDATTRSAIENFRAISVSAVADAKIIQEAFEAVFKTVENPEELASLRSALEGVRVEGFNAAAAIEQIDKKLRALKALPPELAEAFKTLGVTSAASLQQAADAAVEAFRIIQKSGTATAVDIDRAFTAMAEKILAAGQAQGQFGITTAESMLRGIAVTHEQSTALDGLVNKYRESEDAARRAGETAVRAYDEATASALSYAEALEQGRQAAEKVAAAAEEAQRRTDAAFSARTVTSAPSANFERLDEQTRARILELNKQIAETQNRYAAFPALAQRHVEALVREIQALDAAGLRALNHAEEVVQGLRRANATADPATPGSPAPAPTPRPTPDFGPNPVFPNNAPQTVQINLDGQKIFSALFTEENFRRGILPQLQRFLALNR